MPALKKQRIDLRLTDDDKSIIEEAAAISNQTITQFVVASASERAAEVIEQHRDPAHQWLRQFIVNSLEEQTC